MWDIIKVKVCVIITIAIVTGTRPEIIKMYPIIKLFDSRSVNYKYIHTGQHYDYNLFLKFIEEFKIRKPDIYISADISNAVNQVSSIMDKMGSVLSELKPSVVLVEGDTNSVLASALSALKSNIPIVHIESGLRSNDWKTVEEHNRKIVDHVSDILFSPTETSSRNLLEEHVHGEIHTVGNTVIDAIDLCLSKEQWDMNNQTHTGLTPLLGTKTSRQEDFVLVSIHRSENVDNINNLKQILMALTHSNLNYLFPIHPHTFKRIQEYGLSKYIGKNITIIHPVGYFSFLRLLAECRFAITDSGGVQEEVTSPKINKYALVLRDSTERPESVQSNHCVLCRVSYDNILEKIKYFDSSDLKQVTNSMSPYGNGNAASKIVQALEKFYL